MLSVPSPSNNRGRFAPVPRLASPMTMPERSLAASAAEPSRFPSSGPSARADHDRMANAIRALETANREVAQRIDQAIATIHSVLEPGG